MKSSFSRVFIKDISGDILDYIFNRTEKIKSFDLKDLPSDDFLCYKTDLRKFDELISNGDFEIDRDEIYSLRVNMLLGE